MTDDRTVKSTPSLRVLSVASTSFAQANGGSAKRFCDRFVAASKAQAGKGPPGRAAAYLSFEHFEHLADLEIDK